MWRDVTGTGSPILARAKFTFVVDLMRSGLLLGLLRAKHRVELGIPLQPKYFRGHLGMAGGLGLSAAHCRSLDLCAPQSFPGR